VDVQCGVQASERCQRQALGHTAGPHTRWLARNSLAERRRGAASLSCEHSGQRLRYYTLTGQQVSCNTHRQVGRRTCARTQGFIGSVSAACHDQLHAP